MELIEAVLPESQERLLHRFKEIGGRVDFVIFDADKAAADVQSPEIHRQAAISALEVIRRRQDAEAAITSKQHDIPIEKFFRLSIDFDKALSMQCKRLTPEEFFGRRFDIEKKSFQDQHVFDASPDGFAYTIRDTPKGYADAFLDPPHGLGDLAVPSRDDGPEITDLFNSINQEILGGISPHSMIYQWPVDWSDYFDAGQEWWGSFLWTFANPDSARLVVLAASTTD